MWGGARGDGAHILTALLSAGSPLYKSGDHANNSGCDIKLQVHVYVCMCVYISVHASLHVHIRMYMHLSNIKL